MPSGAPDTVSNHTRSGSDLCLACGLCCTGALHARVTVQAEHVELVRHLGLTVEKIDGPEFGFRQPCPLYQRDRCSAYPHHPPACQEYRCALLRKYEDGRVTLEDGLTIIRTAKELLAGGGELAQCWDNEHGLRGSGALRQANAELVLRAVALDVHFQKHFRPPKNRSLETEASKASRARSAKSA
jgi:Fe-S-cluster containining protein